MRRLKRLGGAGNRLRHCLRLRVGAGLALAVLIGSMGSAAACNANLAGGFSNKGNHYQGYNGQLFQISVPAGRSTFPMPAHPTSGEILFASEVMLPFLGDGSGQGRAVPLADCRPGAVEEFKGAGALVAGHQNLYESGVAGIGYRVYYYYRSSSDYKVAPVRYYNEYKSGALVFPFNGSSSQRSDIKARIEFVATGERIVPGTLLPANVYGQATVSNTGGSSPNGPLYRVYLASAVQIMSPTCSINNPAALTVRLPSVSTRALAYGQGREITATTLDVSCSAPSELSPVITVTASDPVSGHPATLPNQEQGTGAARGVGVQVWLYDPAAGTYRNPVFGVDQKNIGEPQESLPSSRWKFQLGASYLPVDATLVAGKVRAGATLKFTYL